MLPQIKPVGPIRIKAAFDDPEFIAELKHDGFRGVSLPLEVNIYLVCG